MSGHVKCQMPARVKTPIKSKPVEIGFRKQMALPLALHLPLCLFADLTGPLPALRPVQSSPHPPGNLWDSSCCSRRRRCCERRKTTTGVSG